MQQASAQVITLHTYQVNKYADTGWAGWQPITIPVIMYPRGSIDSVWEIDICDKKKMTLSVDTIWEVINMDGDIFYTATAADLDHNRYSVRIDKGRNQGDYYLLTIENLEDDEEPRAGLQVNKEHLKGSIRCYLK
jgi:hypothetical protein